MKILAGAYTRDSGQIYLAGKPVELTSPSMLNRWAYLLYYQEFNLSPPRRSPPYLCQPGPRQKGLGRFFGFVDRRQMEAEAQKLLNVVGAQAQPDDIVRSLSVAARQQIEIAKALSVDASVIIMDEPTSALGDDEVKFLFQNMRELKAQGRGIVFITHRLEEIFEVADRIIVFRDGQRVGTLSIAEATTEKIIALMVGRVMDEIFHKEQVEIGEPVLEVRGLSAYGLVEDVSFTLRRGEILGISGLVGAGRTEMVQLLFGAVPKDSGEILVDGKPVDITSPESAMRAGLGLVPEDRANQGLVLLLSVRNNITMPTLNRLSHYGWVDRAAVDAAATDYVGRLSVRTPSLDQKCMFLSGGNQQKVVLAKWLLSNPKVLILDEPTRGIDVGAKAEIHALMSALAKQGMGVIMISSEMPEILGMSDRILVMHEGRMAGILDRKDATQEKIMAYATGQTVEGSASRHESDDSTRIFQRPGGGRTLVAAGIRGQELGILLVLIAMIVIFSLLNNRFLTPVNLTNIMLNFSWTAIAAFGATMVIITGGIDLSAGSVMGLGGLAAAMLLSPDHSTLLGPDGAASGGVIVLAVAVGWQLVRVVCLINGLLITIARLPPFIATLGMLQIARGICYGWSQGWPVQNLPQDFMILGRHNFAIGSFNVPLPSVIMLVLGVIAWLFLTRTVWGYRIFAIGGNMQAARLSGINTMRTQTMVYTIAGLLAGAGGVLLTARLGVAAPTAAQGYELDVIAAVVVGGTSTSGGERQHSGDTDRRRRSWVRCAPD
jgi:ABC-type sugar transport system ATPase subunit/ribose/xylose/arabinose/galactoside ABC-type transport system permease subunit